MVKRLLRGLGLYLCGKGWVAHYCDVEDLREEKGEYWETFGWKIWRLKIPFSKPNRNSCEEMTTPKVLAIWKKLENTPRRKRWPQE